MSNNPYEPLSKDEQEKVNKAKASIEKARKLTIKLAGECLYDPKFIKYQQAFTDFKEKVMRKLSDPMEVDPIKDAHYLRSCINTLNVLGMLESMVKDDVKRGKNNEISG